VEHVPNEDVLFLRVHPLRAPDGELQASAFDDHGPGMSTNWQKHCPTAADSKNLAAKPKGQGVVSLVVGPIRAIPLAVTHTPAKKDRSHTTVAGEKTPEVREKLLRQATWEILPDFKVMS
jgi:hypothetical protein